MKRKKRPSMDGARAKVRRAKLHADELDRKTGEVFDPERYRFAGEVRPDGLLHLYRAVHPPPLPDDLSLIVGDCMHNLRSALDHLATDLVLASGGQPSEATQFPIRRSRTWLNPATSQIETRPAKVSGGVHPDAQAPIEFVQPYHGRYEGEWLGILHQLDVVDKHRHLVLMIEGSAATLTAFVVDGPDAPPHFQPHFLRKPLKHGEVAAKVIYDSPYMQLDPNLRFRVNVEFDEASVRDRWAKTIIGELIGFVDADLLPRFERFFR